MAYDWRPTATRTATTDPGVAVVTRPVRAATSPPVFEELGVAAAVDEFLLAAAEGRALNRSGRPYRPSALRDLRGILTHHVVPHLGDLRLCDVRRRHVQALVDRLAADGLSVSRIRSIISATRALYHYAIEQGYVEFSSADGLVVPTEESPTRSGEAAPDPHWEPRAPREPARRDRSQDDHQPLALLPERVLSLVLRIVVVFFVLIALVTIAESA